MRPRGRSRRRFSGRHRLPMSPALPQHAQLPDAGVVRHMPVAVNLQSLNPQSAGARAGRRRRFRWAESHARFRSHRQAEPGQFHVARKGSGIPARIRDPHRGRRQYRGNHRARRGRKGPRGEIPDPDARRRCRRCCVRSIRMHFRPIIRPAPKTCRRRPQLRTAAYRYSGDSAGTVARYGHRRDCRQRGDHRRDGRLQQSNRGGGRIGHRRADPACGRYGQRGIREQRHHDTPAPRPVRAGELQRKRRTSERTSTRCPSTPRLHRCATPTAPTSSACLSSRANTADPAGSVPASSYAFTVVNRGCSSGNYSFPHEIGHNFGARHDTYVDSSTSPYAYGHGYVDCVEGWRDVMAYPTQCGGTRIAYLSNPNLTYGSPPDPLGTTTTADNVRVHNQNAVTVANFRLAVHKRWLHVYACAGQRQRWRRRRHRLVQRDRRRGLRLECRGEWSWLAISAGSGTTGSGTLNYSVAANAGLARTGTITVGGQAFTVNQAAGCSYSLSPTSASFAAAGGSGTTTLSAGFRLRMDRDEQRRRGSPSRRPAAGPAARRSAMPRLPTRARHAAPT